MTMYSCYTLVRWYGKQAATIRLPNCPGQPLFGLGNHDLQKNCPTWRVQIESKLTPILLHKLQTIKTTSKIMALLVTNHQHKLTF